MGHNGLKLIPVFISVNFTNMNFLCFFPPYSAEQNSPSTLVSANVCLRALFFSSFFFKFLIFSIFSAINTALKSSTLGKLTTLFSFQQYSSQSPQRRIGAGTAVTGKSLDPPSRAPKQEMAVSQFSHDFAQTAAPGKQLETSETSCQVNKKHSNEINNPNANLIHDSLSAGTSFSGIKR